MRSGGGLTSEALRGYKADMPKGPDGQLRPAGTVECAVMVAKIATGEIEDVTQEDAPDTPARRGGKARAEKLSAKRRSEIGKQGASARWNRR